MTEDDAEARLDLAREAEDALDNDLALAIYAEVRRAVGNVPTGRRALRRRADLLLKLGRNDEAAAALDALLVDCGYADGLDHPAAPAERAAGPGGPVGQAELAAALAERAHVAYRSGDGAGITRFAAAAEIHARAAGDPQLVAHALRFVGIAHEFGGRHAQAEATYLALLEVAPDTRHLGPVCNSLGEIARAAGRFGTAVSWYRRFHEEWKKGHGDEANIVYLNNMGAALVELGEHAAGRALLDRAIIEQRRTGYLAMLSETYHYRAASWLAAGDLAAATRDTVEGYLLASELGEGEMMGILLRLLARIRQADGPRRLEALPTDGPATAGSDIAADASPVELVRRSIAILAEADKPTEVARSRWCLGEILLAQNQSEVGLVELEAAQAAFVALGLEHWAEEVARALVHARLDS